MPTEKPHKPEPLTSHDPYPRDPDEQPDPMRERRRNSRKFYAGVDAAIAARPKAPSYITRSEGSDEAGYTITHDDGLGTVIRVEKSDTVGMFVLELTTAGDTARVELGLGVANVLDVVIRNVAGLGVAAPITGSR